MSVATRVGLFVAGLTALFGTAFAAGEAIDPDIGDREAPGHSDDGHGATRTVDNASAPARLVVAQSDFEPGDRGTLGFRVVDRKGRTVDDFDVEHERKMHLIAVRRDLTGYRHVHPRQTASGGWRVDIDFPGAGSQRVFADFVTRGKSYTLSADVDVAGRYVPQPLPTPAPVSDAGDGYRVAVSRDGAERRFTVSKDGRSVDDIEPYLGARGHLVAISEGDLAFQHVHPQDRATKGREIGFDVTLEQAGRYRLFLQFKHDGEVRTAAFTEWVAADRGHADGGGGDHGH